MKGSRIISKELPKPTTHVFSRVVACDPHFCIARAQLDLFPGRHELQQDCNCPDWADVCKHLAAVHYILGERFDEDPFLLFRLRGKTQDEILTSLGTDKVERNTILIPEYTPSPPLTESLSNFWQIGSELAGFSIHITVPESSYPLLERLGGPDFIYARSPTLADAGI